MLPVFPCGLDGLLQFDMLGKKLSHGGFLRLEDTKDSVMSVSLVFRLFFVLT